jgi:hypothetical protein
MPLTLNVAVRVLIVKKACLAVHMSFLPLKPAASQAFTCACTSATRLSCSSGATCSCVPQRSALRELHILSMHMRCTAKYMVLHTDSLAVYTLRIAPADSNNRDSDDTAVYQCFAQRTLHASVLSAEAQFCFGKALRRKKVARLCVHDTTTSWCCTV